MSREAIVEAPSVAPQGDSPRMSRGLVPLAVLLAVAAPLAMYGGRIPGLGEFDYLIYYRLLFYNDFVSSLAMLAAFIVALAVPPLRDAVARLAGAVTAHPVKTCIAAFALLAVTARVVYQGFPLAMDEYTPLLQARIFAQGEFAVTYPRELLDHMVAPGFQGFFILANHATGEAASAYWPGLALLMTPFALFRGEWLLNPLLAAAGVWLIGDLARQAANSEQARGWAMLAALACPQYTVNAISYYAMPGLLTLNLLYLWLLLRPTRSMAFIAGIAGSIALVMHNPVPHALVALPCVIWLLARSERRAHLVPLIAGYLPLGFLLGLGWPMLMGEMGLRHLGLTSEAQGFVGAWLQKLSDVFVAPSMGLFRVRAYAAWKMLIWASPALVLLALVTKPSTAIQRLLLAGMLLSFFFYFFLPYDQGHGWGYRYIHPAWGLVPVVAGAVAASGAASYRALVSASIAAGLLATPVFMHETRSTVSTSLSQQIPTRDDGRSIVFVAMQPGLYSADIVRNYPSDEGKVLRLVGTDAASDLALVKAISPGAQLAVSDHRGSSWTIPPDTALLPPK